MLATSVSDGERSQTGQVHREMGELGWMGVSSSDRSAPAVWVPTR